MANKKFWLGLLVMALAFGMAVIGCDDSSTGGEADTWTKVTRLSQLNGTWKGSFSQTGEGEYEGITMKMEQEGTMTINASEGTMSGSSKQTMTFSGSNINAYWSDIKEDYQSYFVEMGYAVTVNNSKHSLSITQNMPPQPISLSDLQSSGEVQINQKGTKFRLLIDYGDEGPTEIIIYIKQ